jgi:hypothetical protein
MTKPTALLIFALLLSARAFALDGFEKVKCGSDVPRALIGNRLSNERVVVIEGRHKDLGLKDLGGTEISDSLFLASWFICGTEYELLLASPHSVVRDVLPFPPHSIKSPEFIGDCEQDGRKLPDGFIGVMDNPLGMRPNSNRRLKPISAWRIDEIAVKFVPTSVDGLQCSTAGFITVDGGW